MPAPYSNRRATVGCDRQRPLPPAQAHPARPDRTALGRVLESLERRSAGGRQPPRRLALAAALRRGGYRRSAARQGADVDEFAEFLGRLDTGPSRHGSSGVRTNGIGACNSKSRKPAPSPVVARLLTPLRRCTVPERCRALSRILAAGACLPTQTSGRCNPWTDPRRHARATCSR